MFVVLLLVGILHGQGEHDPGITKIIRLLLFLFLIQMQDIKLYDLSLLVRILSNNDICGI